MHQGLPTALPSEAEMASLSSTQLCGILRSQAVTIDALKQQIEWFKRQMFGSKSERLRVLENPQQLALGEVLASSSQTAPPSQARVVATHTRRKPQRDAAVGEAESVPFFDAERVPVQTIELSAPDTEGLKPDEFEVIAQKVSYRLAQRPGSYVVIKYVRPVVKRRDTQAIHCAPAPQGVIEGSRADVSFVVGLLIDKFAYHLLC